MIKLGIIGCGGMGGAHMRRFHTLRHRVSLVATVDVVKERAEGIARHFPGASVAADYREILGSVDAVLLALPHHLHFSVGQACLDAGVHVLLEKPMANYEVACKELIEAAEKSGKVLMIAYCMRFHPLVQRLKALLDAQAYGDVFQVSIWTEQLTRYPQTIGHRAKSGWAAGSCSATGVTISTCYSGFWADPCAACTWARISARLGWSAKARAM